MVFALAAMIYNQQASKGETASSAQPQPSDLIQQPVPKLEPLKELPSTELSSIYYIWVRSFKDSDADGIGDLDGIIAKLDYLSSLGISDIMLSPIFPSPSYHGYETTDYLSIHPDFGDMEDFVRLIAAAREKGINTHLDIVINHTSDQHPWFLSSLENESLYADYYIWRNTLPDGYGYAWSEKAEPTAVWHTKAQRPGDYFYGVFGFASPDLNYSNPAVVNKITETLSHWLGKGVAGYRIDAARYLVESGPLSGQRDTPENINILEAILSDVRRQYPKAEFIGEVFAGTEITPKYLASKQGLSSVFNFEFTYAVQNALRSADEQSEVETADSIRTLHDFYSRAQEVSINASNQLVFLSNHDIGRSEINNDTMISRKIAASLLLMSPLVPTIYYGDEIGLAPYGKNNDVFKRDLMQWTDSLTWADFSQSENVWVDDPQYFTWDDNPPVWAQDKLVSQFEKNVQDQLNIDDSLLKHYRSLLKKRRALSILSAPYRRFELLDIPHFLAINVQSEQEDVDILINVDMQFSRDLPQSYVLNKTFINPINNQQYSADDLFAIAPGEVLLLVTKPL